MFQRFTERGRQVVVLAREEAVLLNQGWIGTEHLLLGILREEGAAAVALSSGGLSLEQGREVVTLLGVGGAAASPGQMPFTRLAKEALELSLRESARLGSTEISPPLLLLGVLATRTGSAACVLRACAIDTDAIVTALDLGDSAEPAQYRPDPSARPEDKPGGDPS